MVQEGSSPFCTVWLDMLGFCCCFFKQHRPSYQAEKKVKSGANLKTRSVRGRQKA